MRTKLVPGTGHTEVEQKVNTFIMGKNIVDVKLTEWVSYANETGGYTAYVLYEDGPPTRQVQVKLFATVGEQDLEQQVNSFVADKTIVDIHFTEWVEYEAQTGGYTALVLYVIDRTSASSGEGGGQQFRAI